MTLTIDSIRIPDSAMARQATESVRDTSSELLFNHSSRVYYWAALAGQRNQRKVDHELLYVACMFHDVGLSHEHCSCDRRFEVDGAFAASDFLKQHQVSQADIDKVWTAIALHTTPGIPEFMAPEIALLTAGVEMDVLGINFEQFSEQQREQVLVEHPRPASFKEQIIDAFYQGIKHKPATTFGNVKADVIKDKESSFKPLNFCSIIRTSRWPG